MKEKMVGTDSLWQRLTTAGSREMGPEELEQVRDPLIYPLEETAVFHVLDGNVSTQRVKKPGMQERRETILRKGEESCFLDIP